MSIGIYGIFRKSDNKCMYIGQSKEIENRIRSHLLKHNKSQQHLWIIVDNKNDYYGKILEEHKFDDREYRLNREAYWIKELNPELNVVRNRNMGKEQKEKMICSKIGKTPWNKNLTKETDERVAKFAKTLSENKTGTHREYYEDGSYHFVK